MSTESFKLRLPAKEFVPMSLQSVEETVEPTYELQQDSYILPGTLHPCQSPINVYSMSPHTVYSPTPQVFFAPSTSVPDASLGSTLNYYASTCGESTAASTPSTPSSMSAGTSAPSSDGPMPHLQIPNIASAADHVSIQQPTSHAFQQPQQQIQQTSPSPISPQPYNPTQATDQAEAMYNNPYFQAMMYMVQSGMLPPPTHMFPSVDLAATSGKHGRNRGKKHDKRHQTPTMALRDQVEKMKEEVSSLTVRLKLRKSEQCSNESFHSLLKVIETRFKRLESERNNLKSANERYKNSQAELKKLRGEVKNMKSKAAKRRIEGKTKK